VTDLTYDARLDRAAAELDDLASRATRAVADLRSRSQALLDDVEAWKQRLDFSRVDAELARMDGRDSLREAESNFEDHVHCVLQRIDDARDESIAAFLRLRDGVETAVRDVARAAGIVFGDTR
jgi:hypothetical protein